MNSLFKAVIFFGTLAVAMVCQPPQLLANENQVNSILSSLELSGSYKVSKQKKLTNNAFHIQLESIIDSSKTTSGYFYQLSQGQEHWIAILKMGSLGKAGIKLSHNILIYSTQPDNFEINNAPSDIKNFLEQYLVKSRVLQIKRGLNIFSMFDAQDSTPEVTHLFSTVGIDIHKTQLQSFVDIYKMSNATGGGVSQVSAEFYATLGGVKSFRPINSLTVRSDGGLRLKTTCTTRLKHGMIPTSLSCTNISIGSIADFQYEKNNYLFNVEVGVGLTPARSMYFYTTGSLQTGVLRIEKLALKKVTLNYTKVMNALNAGSVALRGDIKIGNSTIGLTSMFSPGVTNPEGLGFAGSVDQVTLEDLAKFNLLVFALNQTVPEIRDLPLDKIVFKDVAISYAPNANPSVGITDRGFAFRGILDLFGHDAGKVRLVLDEDGIYTKDEIIPFTVPGLDIKSAKLDIYIPTKKEGTSRLKDALTGNIVFLMVNMDAKILGQDETVKFIISPHGYLFALKLMFAKDLGLDVLASAKLGSLKSLPQFEVHAVTHTSLMQSLKSKLVRGVARDVDSSFGEMANNIDSLKSDIQAKKKAKDVAWNELEKARKKAMKTLKKLEKPLDSAQSSVNKAQGKVNNLSDNINHWKKKRKGYHWYELDKKTKAEVKIIYYEAEKRAEGAALSLAKSVLKALKKSIHLIPIEADPVVMEKAAQYESLKVSFYLAKAALDAASKANSSLRDLSKVILSDKSPVEIDSISMSTKLAKGSFLQAPLIISGSSFGEKWSVGPLSTKLVLPDNIMTVEKDNLNTLLSAMNPVAKHTGMHSNARYKAADYLTLPAGVMLSYNWQKLKGANGVDIAVAGAGRNAQIYLTTENQSLFRWRNGDWIKMPGRAIRVAANKYGELWCINTNKSIFRFDSKKKDWVKMPGLALDIGVGADGSVWVVGTNNRLYKYNVSKGWGDVMGANVSRIDVAEDGSLWAINKTHAIWSYSEHDRKWIKHPGEANDIAVGGGSVWVLGIHDDIWKYSRGADTWVRINGAGHSIAVDSEGLPWVVGSQRGIWRNLGPAN